MFNTATVIFSVKVHLLSAAFLLGLFSSCNSSNNTSIDMNPSDTNHIDRKPAVAGQFYPSDPIELRQSLTSCFKGLTPPGDILNTAAIISPHAGYVFSGEVAAAAFNQLDPQKAYSTIFVIGCSHRASFAGGAIYTLGDYITPLGKAEVDLEIARSLVIENKIFSFDPQYQTNEHSIEVQIPFLQFHLKKPFKIVPILLGTQDPEVCERIAKALKPYFNAGHLFVISSDFSHYPKYEDAVKVDTKLANVILSNSTEKFIEAEESCLQKSIPNLATGCCSWPAVLTLLYMTEKEPGVEYRKIMYRNSGDSKYGEKDRVVGYNAISVSRNASLKPGFELSVSDRKELLAIARKAINENLDNRETPEIVPGNIPVALLQKAGAFVTLKKKGDLRGCIGHFEADNSLYQIVQKMAVSAATQDYRFSTVRPEEMKDIEIDISVLTPMRKIQSISEIQLGRDGIYIQKGGKGGTFLPQVATDTGWTLEEFLGHCARDKAGIGWDGWKDKDTEIYIYQALVFEE
jgi:AmmeMemoRadiSam system protein B/AmmeMemoRadiSam system protein A